MGVLNQDPNMVQNKKKINPFSNLNDLLQTNTGYGHLYADKLANLIMMNGLKPKAVATVIRCLAQLKPSKGLTLEVSIIAARKQGVPDRAVIDTTWIREISYMHVTCMS